MFERRYIFQGPSFLAFMLDFGGVQTLYNAKQSLTNARSMQLY